MQIKSHHRCKAKKDSTHYKDLVPTRQTDAFVEVVDVNVGNGAQMNPGTKHFMRRIFV